MSQQNARGNLANVGAFAAHVRSSDDLKIGFFGDHSAIISDARRWILYFYKRVAAFNQIELLSVVHFWPYVCIVARDLSKGSEDIELSDDSGDLLEQGIVS